MSHRFHPHRGLDLDQPLWDRSSQSLLTEGVFASNIDSSVPGHVRIALWDEWRPMLEEIHQVGPVWSMARNAYAVLAVQGEYPHLNFSSNPAMAEALGEASSLIYHFSEWKKATAFDSTCCCGNIYGWEVENNRGEVFHRICLAKDTDRNGLVEWVQRHQATGLESFGASGELEVAEEACGLVRPITMIPGTLTVPTHLLRSVLISAAEREIAIDVGVASHGITLTASLEIGRANENRGWLVFSGPQRALYVEAESDALMLVEPKRVEGESVWALSLVDSSGLRLLRIQSGIDDRHTWNRLIQEKVLRSPEILS